MYPCPHCGMIFNLLEEVELHAMYHNIAWEHFKDDPHQWFYNDPELTAERHTKGQ